MNENQILSQEEINALIGGDAGVPAAPSDTAEDPAVEAPPETQEAPEAAAPAVEAAPQAPPAPVAAAAPAPAAGPPPAAQPPAAAPMAPAAQAGQAPVTADPAAQERIAKLESALAESDARIRQVEASVQEATQQVQMLVATVQDMMGNLGSTPAYGVQKTFTCGTCSAQGTVAIPVKCTTCQTDTMFGWWPGQ